MTARTHTKPKTDEAGTRERILRAAAPLFAENGFDATGVRAIAAAAEVNIAAVNYHFGSKDALVAAVGERHVSVVNERRLAALDAACKGGKPTVEAVVEAFIAPSVRFMTQDDPSNLLLMRLIINHAKSDPDNTGRRIRDAMIPTLGRFVDALALALPGSTRPSLHEGLHLVIGAFLHAMTCTAMLEAACPGIPSDPESVIRRLVSFGSAGVRAVATR